MIARLAGKLIFCQPPAITVDVNGVGYDVSVPMTTVYQLPNLGESLILHTHLSVSETSQQLFGFASEKDRMLFRQLIKVSGIGPKMAVSIMSLESDSIAQCIAQESVQTLVKIPGVGKRTAERIIVEMRGKLEGWQSDAATAPKVDHPEAPMGNPAEVLMEDAQSALVNLGYKASDAQKAVKFAYNADIDRSEDLIRLALKKMLPLG